MFKGVDLNKIKILKMLNKEIRIANKYNVDQLIKGLELAFNLIDGIEYKYNAPITKTYAKMILSEQLSMCKRMGLNKTFGHGLTHALMMLDNIESKGMNIDERV